MSEEQFKELIAALSKIATSIDMLAGELRTQELKKTVTGQ